MKGVYFGDIGKTNAPSLSDEIFLEWLL